MKGFSKPIIKFIALLTALGLIITSSIFYDAKVFADSKIFSGVDWSDFEENYSEYGFPSTSIYYYGSKTQPVVKMDGVYRVVLEEGSGKFEAFYKLVNEQVTMDFACLCDGTYDYYIDNGDDITLNRTVYSSLNEALAATSTTDSLMIPTVPDYKNYPKTVSEWKTKYGNWVFHIFNEDGTKEVASISFWDLMVAKASEYNSSYNSTQIADEDGEIR